MQTISVSVPVCDLDVVMPNGQKLMVWDGSIETEVDLAVDQSWGFPCIDVGGVEVTGGSLILQDEEGDLIRIRLDKGHPVALRLQDQLRSDIIDEAIEARQAA